MAEKYAESVKKALDKLEYDFQELASNQPQKTIYSAQIESSTGELVRKMKLVVDEKEKSLTFRTCLEAGVPYQMHPEIYQLINEVQNKWYFVRMYLNCDDDLIADYKTVLERLEASLAFQDNVRRIAQNVIDVSMRYAALAHKAVHENEKLLKSRLSESQINLNPFQEGGSYDV